MNEEVCADNSPKSEHPETPRPPRFNRALKPDAQAFDAISITTVPRYKTSGLSGDEWRISAKVEFFRKGRSVHEQHCRDVETACRLMAWFHAKACDDGKGFFAGENDLCDQEGCSEPATVTYALKKSFCTSCGHGREPPFTSLAGDKYIRRFCERHSTRGDCGLDDADTNYERIEGEPAPPPAADQKPATVIVARVAVDTPAASATHTKDKLAAALREAGLEEMAAKAAEGYYHDFLSPLATPCVQLSNDLAAVGTPAALALRERHHNGEFDASPEESEAWAKGPEGQAAFNELTKRRP